MVMINKSVDCICHTFFGGPEKTLKCRCTKKRSTHKAQKPLCNSSHFILKVSQVSKESEKQNAF